MNSRLVFSLLFGVTLVFTACKKDEGSPTNSTNNSSSFTFKVDGAAVTVDSAMAVLYTLGIPPNNREIDVFAFKGGSQVLEMHFLPRTGAQTAAQNFNGAWLTYESGAMQYHSQSGTLTLATCDTTGGRFEGTFNFVGQQFGGSATKSITEGTLLVTRFTRQ
ncbi:MAG: hypothetical protein HY961_10040 [Ignavibacteriae bacterium]|nr:hypothetical protein [Ignavibacteriota bacterium]